MFRSFLLFAVLALVPSDPPANDVLAILDKLDASSARFTSAEAKVHRESFNNLIKEVDLKQDGSLYVMRAKDGKTQFGLRTDGKEARTVEYKDGVIRDLNPKLNCFDTVKKQGIDTYVSLGFGASGKDLAKNWNVNDLGPETIDGTKTEKLDLTPIDPAVAANVKHVTMWIDLERDVSLKVIFYSPNKDYSTATYSDIKVTSKINLGAYAIKGKPCS